MTAPAAARFSTPAAGLLGAASVAGFAPLGWFPVPILALAALLVLWQRAASPGRAALAGFVFGLGLFGTGVSWVYISLHDYGLMPAPLAALATLLFCAILALYPAAAGWLLAMLRTPAWLQMLVAAPALWVFAEWLRSWLFTGFPWLALGYSQIDGPLAGFAPILGVYGLSLAVLVAAGLIALAFIARGAMLLVAPLAILALLGAGYALKDRGWTEPVGEPFAVSLLQGNIPQDLKFAEDRYQSTLETYARLAKQQRARLIVMPETAIPRFLDAIDPEYLQRLTRIAKGFQATMLIGVPARDAGGRYYNGVVSLGGPSQQSYAKSHLVPFGEFIPPGFGWIVSVLQMPLSDFTRGAPDQAPLAAAGQQVAVNICYEDAFGEEIIRALPQATLLANVSNIAWFGDSLAPEQHLDMSRMRALETGRFMLRATNTGVTAIIDAHGRVVSRLPLFTEGALAGVAQGYRGATPYVRLGNYAVLALCFVMLALCVLKARKR